MGDGIEQESGGRDGRAAAAAIAVFAALSLLCAVASQGFLTADALTHYLYARYALHRPTYLVDVWGRPLVTALYAIPAAAGGRLGVRLVSLVLAIGCSLVACRIARGQGIRRPVLALIFTLAQPLVFLNSFAEMTELPFAALAGAAFLAYQSRRWALAAALVSFVPLARPEGFGLLLLACAGLLWARKPFAMLVLPVPLLLWNHAGWLLYGRHGAWWRWLVDNWPYSPQSTYSAGSIFTFVALLPAVVGPFLLPATLVGVCRSIRPQKTGAAAHDRLCVFMTAAIPLGVLVVHSLLYRLGRMASYGEPRYLLVAAPFWAVLSARGWEWAFDRLGWRHPLRWAAAASLVPLAVNAFYPVLPLRPPDHWNVARAFADACRTSLAARGYVRVVAAHPAVSFYLDVDPQDARAVGEWHRSTVADPKPGTVLLWDPIYAARNAHADRAITLEEVRRAGWLPLPELDEALSKASETTSRRPTPDPADVLSSGEGWHVFLSPLGPAGSTPKDAIAPTPPNSPSPP